MKQAKEKTNRICLSLGLGVIVSLFAAIPHVAHAGTVTWIDGSSYWDIATNWDLGVPTAADDAIIDRPNINYVVVRSTGGPFTVNSLTMPGDDRLTVSGSLTVNGTFTHASSTDVSRGGSLILNGSSSSANLLQNGTVGGTGVYTVTGPAYFSGSGPGALQKDSGTTVLQSTSTIFWLNVDTGRTINNAATGTVTFPGSAGSIGSIIDLDFGSGAGGGTFQNDGVFITTQTGITRIYNTYGSGVFNNAGTFVKQYDGSIYTSDTVIYTAFNNSGVVDVQTGRLYLVGGGNSTGSFAVASGATLVFGNSNHTLSQSPTGLGTTEIATYGGGTVNANGGINTYGLRLTSGTLNLGADSTVTNFMQATGTLVGAGLTVTGTASFSNDAPQQGAAITRLEGNTGIDSIRLDAGRTLQNAATGTVTWTGNPNSGVSKIDLDYTSAAGSGTIQNDGLFVAAGNYTLNIINTNGGGVFNNAGTFRKQGSATTTVNVPLTNTGLVDVQAGTLSLNVASSHTGTFTVASGGTLAFAGGGTHTLPANLSGLGTTKVGNATVVNANNGISTSGLVLDGGTLNLGVSSSVSTYSQTNGTLNGTSTLTVTDVSSFNGDSNVNTPFRNLGTMNVQTGTLSLTTASGFTNEGAISTAKGATTQTTSGGFTNNGTLMVSGTYVGDLMQTSMGKMRFELGSRTSFDVLNVLGNLALDGSLEIQSVGGFDPWNGDTFTILSFDDGVTDLSDLTGIFNSISWSGFDPSAKFDVSYLDHSVMLTVTSDVTPVPVPPSVWLLGSGLVALMSAARRRKS